LTSELMQYANTMPANVSALVCARQPAMVTGLEAPICPKVLIITGRPKLAASAITPQAGAENRYGGTTWLIFSDKKGRWRNASGLPAMVKHISAISHTCLGSLTLTITCLLVPASAAKAVLTSSARSVFISVATTEREKNVYVLSGPPVGRHRTGLPTWQRDIGR